MAEVRKVLDSPLSGREATRKLLQLHQNSHSAANWCNTQIEHQELSVLRDFRRLYFRLSIKKTRLINKNEYSGELYGDFPISHYSHPSLFHPVVGGPGQITPGAH